MVIFFVSVFATTRHTLLTLMLQSNLLARTLCRRSNSKHIKALLQLMPDVVSYGILHIRTLQRWTTLDMSRVSGRPDEL